MPLALVRCAYDINLGIPENISFTVVNGNREAYISCQTRSGEHIFNFKEKDYSWIDGNDTMYYTTVFGMVGENDGIPVKHIVSPQGNVHFEAGGTIEPAIYTIFEIMLNIEGELTTEIELADIHDTAMEMLRLFIEKYRYVTQDNTIKIPGKDDFVVIEYLQSTDVFKEIDKNTGIHFKPLSLKYNYDSVLKKRRRKGKLKDKGLKIFAEYLKDGRELAMYIRLLMEAKEHALIDERFEISILKSETAFEVYIQHLLVRLCEAKNIRTLMVGKTSKNYKEVIFNGNIREHLIKNYLKELANLSIAGTKEYNEWYDYCFDIRNQIVHRGNSDDITEEDAKKAFESVNRLIEYIEQEMKNKGEFTDLQ